MSDQSNPYQSPAEVTPDGEVSERASFLPRLGDVCFWCGGLMLVLGIVALFLNSVPVFGFLIVAFTLLVIAVAVSDRYRKRASLALALTLFLATVGFYQMLDMRATLARERALRARQQAVQAEKLQKQVELKVSPSS